MDIMERLRKAGAVHEKGHFALSLGGHSTAYINCREVGHETRLMREAGGRLGQKARGAELGIDFVLGPETLGRTLADHVAADMDVDAIWCDMGKLEDGTKVARFNEKLDFGRLLEGKSVYIVDDLLTTGGSVKAVIKLAESCGAAVVAVGVMVRRSPEVTAATIDVPLLYVIEDVDGFVEYRDQADCEAHGPCRDQVPMQLRPGHGHEWINSNPDYPWEGDPRDAPEPAPLC